VDELYPYASGNLIEQPNSYFYTPYHGNSFFAAWRDSRQAVRQTLPDSLVPPGARVVNDASDYSADLLERAIAGDEQLRESFVKKFEITKRIHERYDKSFRAIDKTRRHDFSLYVRAADLFESSYRLTGSARYFNVYLKCLDTLCAHAGELAGALPGRLAWHLERENEHFMRMAQTNGVQT